MNRNFLHYPRLMFYQPEGWP